MNIYTRNGDFGFTTDINGQSVSKASPLMALQGTVDEVNSFLGLLRSKLASLSNPIESTTLLEDELKLIQEHLFYIGSDISSNFAQTSITDAHVTFLENAIDGMLLKTGELHSFLYLSGIEAATTAHCLRSITRRCERVFVDYIESLDISKPPIDYKYLNRLADYFFQCARYINWLYAYEEEIISPSGPQDPSQ